MQTKPTTGLRTAATDYVTIVQQAFNKIKGFSVLYKELERPISNSGKSKSTLTNYSRQLAHLAPHYNCFPLDLDAEQVMGITYTLLKVGVLLRQLFLNLLCMDCGMHAVSEVWSTSNFRCPK